MKILYITPYFFPEGSGLENYAYQVAKRLARNGVYVLVVTSTFTGTNKIETIDNIKVIRLKPNFIISATPVRLTLILKLLQIIKQEKFDLIHAHTPVPYFADMAALASYLKKIPLLITYHASNLKKGIFWIDSIARIYKIIEYFTLKKASKIVAVSGNIRSGILAHWQEKTSVITPGVDTTLFTRADYLKNNPKRILFVGSLKKSAKWKGLDILLKTLKEIITIVPDVELRIAGAGDYFNYYQVLAVQLGIINNIKFLGKKSHLDLVSEYQAARCTIIPTISSVEGCPTVMFESLACATPVIGSRIAGIPYIINENNGILVTPGNVRQLKDAIIKMIKNDDLATKLGNSGYEQMVKDYSWDTITSKYIEVYNSLK